MSIGSHSQTSIRFVTVYGFLENRLPTVLCNVYESSFKSHDLISCLDFDILVAAFFCNVENGDGWLGE